jgi:copper(I)-binding protein
MFPMPLPVRASLLVLAATLAAPAHAEGHLVVENAWIRTAPPGASMLAGYARLTNRGDEALSVNGVASPRFGKASLHETRVENGVSSMRPLPSLVIAPGASVELAPGGKHLMLMQPRGEVAAGQRIAVEFQLGDKRREQVEFVVADEAP